MKKAVVGLFLSTFAAAPVLAADITSDMDTVDSSYVNMSDSTVTNFVDGGEITGTAYSNEIINMKGGSINVAGGGIQITNMSGGNITTLSGYAHVDNMTGGTIGEMKKLDPDNRPYIGTIDGGTVTKISGGEVGSYVDGVATGGLKSGSIGTITDSVLISMSGGDLGTASGQTVIHYVKGGTISNMESNAKIYNFEGGMIDEKMSDTSSIDRMTGGTIKEMTDNSKVDNMKGGVVEKMSGSSSIFAIEKNDNDPASPSTIKLMTDQSKISHVTLGHIETMDGDSIIENFYSGTVDIIQGNATITNLQYNDASVGGSNIGELTGNGSITNMLAGYVDKMTGGTIVNMSEDANNRGLTIVNTISAGEITNMSGGTVVELSGTGKITNMTGGIVDDMVGGTISYLKGGTVTDMTSGTVGELSATGKITNMSGGTVTNMAGGSINYLTNGTVTNMKGGTVDELSSLGRIANMYGGRVTSMKGGIITFLSNGTVTDMTNGTIVQLSSIGKITNMTGGSVSSIVGGGISYLKGGTVDNMSGGTVGELSETGNITNMFGGTVSSMAGGSINYLKGGTVTDMTSGTVGELSLTGKITNMTGGSVSSIVGGGISYLKGGTVSNISGGTVGELSETGNIINMTGGTVTNMIGGSIDYLDNGIVYNMSAGTVEELSLTGRIASMTGGNVTSMIGGTISILTNGRVNNMSAGTVVELSDTGHIENMSGGSMTNMLGGSINKLSNGTVVNMKGGLVSELSSTGRISSMTGGVVDYMIGGSIISLSNATVNNMSAGTISTLNGWSANGIGKIVNMTGGTVTTLAHEAKINNLSGGIVSSIKEGGSIDNMSGTATVGMIQDWANITNMTGGTVEIMATWSKIGKAEIDANGLPTISEGIMTNGTIKEMLDYSGIYAEMQGGTIEQMKDNSHVYMLKGGVIEKMSGDSTIGMLGSDDITIVGVMTGGTINEMTDNSRVHADMQGGVVEKMTGTSSLAHLAGGSVGDIGATAYIDLISAGTIYGNVESGSNFTVEDSRRVNLYAEDTSKVFDRVVNAGSGASVHVKDYQFGSNSEINMGDDSTLSINSVDLNKVSFANGGMFNFDNSNGFVQASIAEFNSTGSVTFNFSVDEETGGDNDFLTISSVGAGSTLEHLVGVSARHIETGHREPIDLLRDESGSLSLSLLNGDFVGIGSKNYILSKDDNLWSLVFFRGAISDQAKVIGSIANTRLMTVYSITNALHKRLGDIRNFNISAERPGTWFRSYTDYGGFKDLASVRTHNYGFEGGIDKTTINGCTGRMISGIAVGINYAKQDVKTHYSRDGGGDSITPYIGIYNTLDWYSGFYIDTIARYAYIDQDGKYYDGANIKNEFNNQTHVFMLSAEAGYKYQLTDRLAIEPRAEIMYAFLKGDSFRDDSGFEAKYADTQSILGSAGVLLRYKMDDIVEPYIKLTYLHELDGKTGVRYDGTKYDARIDGGRFEVGLGFVAKTDSKFDFYGETTYQTGHKSFRDYNLNLGLRYNF